MPRRVELILRRQLRRHRDCRVEDQRVRLCDEQSRRITLRIAGDHPARRVRRVAIEAKRSNRRAIEHRRIVQMEHEHRRVGRRAVDLLERRHPPLGELKLVPAADDAHPLRWRSPFRLRLQLGEGLRQTRHAIPAEFEIEVEPRTNDVEMRIVQPRNDAAMIKIDPLRLRPCE